ncbi:MAG TPA: serine/threonine-protein kinase [Planctomycetota bacterium]|jgi:serine/threonine-protein kinase
MFEIPGVTITAKIAEGACAEIYTGMERGTGKVLALKILHQRHRSNKTEFKRLLAEGELVMRFGQQENLVQGVRTGNADGLPYLIMEYVRGKTLREIIVERKKLSELDILRITKALGRALCALHALNYAHKDMKPDNVIVSHEGVIKLLDFGFAEKFNSFKLFGRSLDGSLPYLAPEMFSTKRGTASTDVYALGCTLYECATGIQPFGGMSDIEIVTRQKDLGYTPPPIRQANPGISPLTEKMILKAIEKDVTKRFQTAAELLLDLKRNPAFRDTPENSRLSMLPAKPSQTANI